MNPLFRYLIAVLTAGTLGLVSGIWIAHDDPPETTEIQSAPHRETIRFIPQTSKRDGQVIPRLKLNDIYQRSNIFDQLHFAYNIARASDFEQLAEYLGIVILDHDPLFNHNIASIFLERMVVLDPLSSLEFINTHHAMDQNTYISHILTSWIRQDPEAAIDYFKSMTNQQLKYIVGARLLADPTLQNSGLLAEVESELGSYSEQIIEQIRLKRMPASAAFEEARLRTDHRRFELMMRAAARWYQQDPEAALQSIATHTNQAERKQLLQVIMSMQLRMDPELALEILQQYAPGDKALQRQALISYANQDPVRALPKIEAFVSETGNYDTMSILISSWVQIDEIAALSYVESIPEPDRQYVIQNMAPAYIHQSPEEGMAWVMSLGPEYNQTAKRSALHALSRYPEIAEDWLDRLDSEPQLQGVLLKQVAQRKAQTSPGDAYEWLENYSDSPEIQAARNSVLQTWAQTEPQRVAALLGENSDNSSPDYLYNMIASTWVSTDIDAALAWIESLPESASKEAALGSAITSIRDPERAISLLDDLSENKARNYKMQIAYNWLGQTTDEVETIIRRLELTDQDAEVLRQVRQQQLNHFRPGGIYR